MRPSTAHVREYVLFHEIRGVLRTQPNTDVGVLFAKMING